MTVEMSGQQLRIRIHSPRRFSKFRIQDVGTKGRLQRVAGLEDREWRTQAWRLNLRDYRRFPDAMGTLNLLKSQKRISGGQVEMAMTLADRWWKKNRRGEK